MKLSPAGEAFIKKWESCKLSAYLDSSRIWTVGWGHTGPGVKMGTNWTQAKADAIFYLDIVARETAVDAYVKVPVSQAQYDVLVSLVYNIGVGGPTRSGIFVLKNGMPSTFLTKLNDGDYEGAASEILRWNHIGNSVSTGLTNRRNEEALLFRKEIVWPSSTSPPRQSLVQWLKSIVSGFFTSRS